MDKIVAEKVKPKEDTDCHGNMNMKIEAAGVPMVTWDDVGGLADVKTALQDLIKSSTEHSDLFEKYGLNPSTGILLYGPTGCGKRMLAECVAKELQSSFMYVESKDILDHVVMSGYHWECIRQIFDKARAASPCILFLHNFEYLSSHTSEHDGEKFDETCRLINQLMTELDGLSKKTGILVIAATTRPELIDSPLLKPGRIQEQVFVRLPDEDCRLQIMKIKLKHTLIAKDVDLEHLAKLTMGYTSAALTHMCQFAHQLGQKETLDTRNAEGPDKARLECRDIDAEGPDEARLECLDIDTEGPDKARLECRYSDAKGPDQARLECRNIDAEGPEKARLECRDIGTRHTEGPAKAILECLDIDSEGPHQARLECRDIGIRQTEGPDKREATVEISQGMFLEALHVGRHHTSLTSVDHMSQRLEKFNQKMTQARGFGMSFSFPGTANDQQLYEYDDDDDLYS